MVELVSSTGNQLHSVGEKTFPLDCGLATEKGLRSLHGWHALLNTMLDSKLYGSKIEDLQRCSDTGSGRAMTAVSDFFSVILFSAISSSVSCYRIFVTFLFSGSATSPLALEYAGHRVANQFALQLLFANFPRVRTRCFRKKTGLPPLQGQQDCWGDNRPIFG